MDKHWTIPKKGFVKLNIHDCFSQKPLLNGNKTGLGCVIRDDKDKILKMITGTQTGLIERRNQLFGWVIGLRECYLGKHERVIVETDNLYAIKAWHNLKKEIVTVGEKKELEDLRKRDDDPNLMLEIRLVSPYCNNLAIYLAKDGGETREELIVTEKPFKSVLEIWYDDLGLGSP